MARDIKNDIIQHLKNKGNYDFTVDDMTIDILLKNIEYARDLEEMLRTEGLIVAIPNGNGIITTKENPAYGTYCKCIDNIHHCASKLGIHRKERIALKLLEEKHKDEFDIDFSK
jgi:phage terminase small subunit